MTGNQPIGPARQGMMLSESDHRRGDGSEQAQRRQCRAITSKGTRCSRRARPGTSTCGMHTKASARPTAGARELIYKIGPGLWNPDANPITDPIAELARLGGIYRDAVNWIGKRVNDLHDEIRYVSSGTGTEQLRAEVQLWERLLSSYQKHLTDMAKLDIDQRMAAMREMYAAAVVAGIRAMLSDLNLTPGQQSAVPEAARRHLAIATGAAGAAVVAGDTDADDVTWYH